MLLQDRRPDIAFCKINVICKNLTRSYKITNYRVRPALSGTQQSAFSLPEQKMARNCCLTHSEITGLVPDPFPQLLSH